MYSMLLDIMMELLRDCTSQKCSMGILILLPILLLSDQGSGQMTVDYDWSETECPDPDTPMMVKKVGWGVPGRAYLTLPDGLSITLSKMEGAGFGVISNTFIPSYTWLGEYEGELVALKHADQFSPYTWSVHRDHETTAYIDGYNFHTSSYHRYINTPNRYQDENVIPLECYGKLFYMTNKDIVPGDELLVYYGVSYARDLKIDLNTYFNVSQEFRTAGLDLNNDSHRESVEESGFKLQEVQNANPRWLPVFLGDTLRPDTLYYTMFQDE